MPHLVVVLPPTPVVGQVVEVARKTRTGLAALSERWVGRLTAVLPPAAADPGNLDLARVPLGDIGADAVVGSPVDVIRRLEPDLVQVSLHRRDHPVLRLGVPTVVMAENPARETVRYSVLGRPASDRARIALGGIRLEIAHRRAISRAAALQCNGWPAWDAYHRLARRSHPVEPLLFFDTRLTRQHVAVATSVRVNRRDLASAGLHLAFSGRLHAAKGPDHAVQLALELERRGVPHRLSVFGSGPLEETLRTIAGPSARFAGTLPFDPDWVVAMAEVDLAVLPHLQGDPSGTYLEAAGTGAPVLGYDNAAMRALAQRSGLGWAVRMGSVGAMADVVEHLAGNPRELSEASARVRTFAASHSLEDEFDARADHLLRVHHAVAGRGR